MNFNDFLNYLEPRIERIPESGCWIWKNSLNHGYGQATINGKKGVKVHRLSWIIYNNQEIPSYLFVCHKCDVRSCVNPEHLFIGSAAENNHDSINKGRRRGPIGKISKEIRDLIKKEYEVGGILMKELSKKYNCSLTSIHYYIKGRKSQCASL